MSLRVQSRDQDDVKVLNLSGTLQMGRDSIALEETLSGLIRDGHNKIVLNLSNIFFLDSCGVGEIVNGFSIAKKSGGALKLACLSERVHEVLEMTHLLEVLDIFETEESAMASFE